VRGSLTNLREHRATLMVTGLSSAFGVLLLETSSVLATIVSGDVIGQSSSVQVVLVIVASVFLGIAVYVGAIVTANTFATIIAGRTKTIALLRLIGASSRTLRRQVAAEGLVIGLFGAVAGAAVGILLATLGIRIALAMGAIPSHRYSFIDWMLGIPVVVVTLATWAAAWVGSRKVLVVSPIQATGQAEEPSFESTRRRPVRSVFAILLFAAGTALLAFGVALGMFNPMGLFVAFFGGIVSFSGFVLGAHLIMPTALRGVGALFGRGAVAKLAAANAVRYPERSSRATIGLVIGVTLVTTFGVAAESFAQMVERAREQQPEVYGGGFDQLLNLVVVVFSAMIGFSIVIAAIGLVNNLSLGVLQRTRELGLLRALGFTGGQVRGMIMIESAQMSLTAVGIGVVLGTGYGWAGAQSMLGSIPGGGFLAPSVPWLLVALAVIGAALLALVATVSPSRRATRASPVSALAAQ
jgi:putative ABC transport system permease protein